MGTEPQPGQKLPGRPSAPFQVAFLRALYGGLLTGAYVGLGAYAVPPHQAQASAIAGAVALLGYMLHRGALEGYVDSR